MSTKIAVIYYSVYGHCKKLADAAAQAAAAEGAEVGLLQVPETLPSEVLSKMGAAPRTSDPFVSKEQLPEFDGFIFVIPTRYGRAVAQFSAFFDQTGGLWATQALNKKFATVITSTATQHGGQETTALTTIPFFAHHGMIFVPIGYKYPTVMDMTEILGGSPYGASSLAGSDGTRQPNAKELELCAFHGQHFTEIVAQFKRGA